jgi:hypothetical protein
MQIQIELIWTNKVPVLLESNAYAFLMFTSALPTLQKNPSFEIHQIEKSQFQAKQSQILEKQNAKKLRSHRLGKILKITAIFRPHIIKKCSIFIKNPQNKGSSFKQQQNEKGDHPTKTIK